jgi:ATP-binding cassette subfamily B protein
MKILKPMKWIRDNAKNERAKMWILIVSNIIFSLLSVAFALSVKVIIDGATNADKIVGKTQLIYGAVLILIIVVLQFAFRIITNYLSEHIKGRLEVSIRTRLYNSILSKKYQKITAYHSGELMTRLNSDVSVVADGYTGIVPNLVAALARLICAIVAIILLQPIFATVFVVAGILVFATLTLMRSKLKSFHKDVQNSGAKVHSYMQESIENVLAIKGFSVNDKMSYNAINLQKENFKMKMKRAKYSVGGHAIYNMIFSLGYILALVYGGYLIYAGALTYGTLSAILQLVNNVQVPFASLSNVFPRYYSMIASAERIIEIEVMENEKELLPEKTINKFKKFNKIVANDISFSYEEDSVLSGASLTVNRGDFVMIKGRSGIGKSTFLKLLLGVYQLKEGNINAEANGKTCEISEQTRSLFSYVPQQNLLFSGTVLENVTFISGKVDDEKLKQALDVSCVSDFIDDLPDGINTKVGENGLGLSEGQIQRIAIARALLNPAPVLLLDESTSALDGNTERKLLSNLKTLGDVTVIIVSHKNAAKEICNRIIKIENKKFKEVIA